MCRNDRLRVRNQDPSRRDDDCGMFAVIAMLAVIAVMTMFVVIAMIAMKKEQEDGKGAGFVHGTNGQRSRYPTWWNRE